VENWHGVQEWASGGRLTAHRNFDSKAPWVEIGNIRVDRRAPHCVKGVLTFVQEPTHTRRALAGGGVCCTECSEQDGREGMLSAETIWKKRTCGSGGGHLLVKQERKTETGDGSLQRPAGEIFPKWVKGGRLCV
jgi:hypothetical protein